MDDRKNIAGYRLSSEHLSRVNLFYGGSVNTYANSLDPDETPGDSIYKLLQTIIFADENCYM